MKRTAAISLLMICGELLLCAFLVTWLRAQWQDEEQNLRTDLRLKFNSATQTTTDSVIRSAAGKLPPPEGPQGERTFKLMVKGDQTQRVLPPDAELKPTVMIHRSVWSNGRDSMTLEDRDTTVTQVLSNVQIVLGAVLSDSILESLTLRDTGGLRRRMVRSLHEDKQFFTFRYLPAKTGEKDGLIILRGEGMNRLFTAGVTGYYPYLFRKVLPQLLFAIALILITSLGFVLAIRSLRREKRLSQMRNSLMGNMSHELKTPVSTVKVALEALTDEVVLQDKDTVHAYVDMASKELQRLELLINSTLHTSLLESGKLSMQQAPFDLHQLTESVVETMRLRLQKQHATVTLQFAAGDYTYTGDRLHLQGVLLNIIDNALKYGGEQVQISIEGTKSDTAIGIIISDNGPGIPKAYQKRVFEKFFRVPTGNLHLVKGYGLGLSYAAEVMRLHGGSITVGGDEANGASFTLRFPL